MTKAELIKILEPIPDNETILIKVSDFTFDHISWERIIVAPNTHKEQGEGYFIEDDVQDHQDSFPAFTLNSLHENFY